MRYAEKVLVSCQVHMSIAARNAPAPNNNLVSMTLELNAPEPAPTVLEEVLFAAAATGVALASMRELVEDGILEEDEEDAEVVELPALESLTHAGGGVAVEGSTKDPTPQAILEPSG